MSQPQIDDSLRAEFASAAAEAGCELLEADFQGNVLRVVIDAPEGVTHGDCTQVSRRLSALLDAVGFGTGSYVLEVSSPGLDRKLYGPEDYRRFSGRRVRVTWREGAERVKRTVVGTLERSEVELEDDEVTVIEAEDRRHVIPMKDIELARLEIEL